MSFLKIERKRPGINQHNIQILIFCITADFPGRCYTAIESGMCATPLSQLVRRTKCCCVVSGQETLGKCFAAVGPEHQPERCAAIGTRKHNFSFVGAS